MRRIHFDRSISITRNQGFPLALALYSLQYSLGVCWAPERCSSICQPDFTAPTLSWKYDANFLEILPWNPWTSSGRKIHQNSGTFEEIDLEQIEVWRKFDQSRPKISTRQWRVGNIVFPPFKSVINNRYKVRQPASINIDCITLIILMDEFQCESLATASEYSRE